MSDDPPPPEDLPAERNPGVTDIAALAAAAALRTAGWTARTYLHAGRRLLDTAAHPETAPELVNDLRRTVRDAAREITGVPDLSLPLPEMPERANGKEPPSLTERGDRLLRQSADVRYEEEAHPAYARILDELAPDEGRILRLLLLSGPQPSVDVRTGGPIGMVSSRLIAPGLNMIGARAGCRYVDRVPQYLNNLFRLGLVWFSRETLRDPLPYQVVEAQPEVLEAMKSVRMAKIVRRSIHLTAFGEDFCRVALNLGREVDFTALPEHGSLDSMKRNAAPDSRPLVD
jgi:hypothetical protein